MTIQSVKTSALATLGTWWIKVRTWRWQVSRCRNPGDGGTLIEGRRMAKGATVLRIPRTCSRGGRSAFAGLIAPDRIDWNFRKLLPAHLISFNLE